MDTTEIIENHTFDELKVGDTAHLRRILKAEDIQLFAAMSGDVNPAHVDPAYASSTQFHGIMAHGMWGASLISTVIGTELPGPGSIYMGQSLRFERPVHIGDTVDVGVTVTEKDPHHRHVTLDCRCTNQLGEQVISGSALVQAPSEKVRRPRMQPMQVRLRDATLRYKQLLALTQGLPAISVAVVYPCSDEALRGALTAADMGLIRPTLIGPLAQMQALAQAGQLSLLASTLVDAPDEAAAAALAVAMARRGDVHALMKGSLHTDELMSAVLNTDIGLRGARRMSHVYVLDVPSYPRPLLISDAAINIEPDLQAKRDIVCNAIDLAHAIGIVCPKVAILAAVETVNARMRATVDASALCKMAERGQIEGAVLDGPLAFDNAISPAAAREKGLISAVAGQADILIAPDLESGNMMAKQLEYLADAQIAGIVMGGRVPVILTSRADGVTPRVASCALAMLVVKAGAATTVASPDLPAQPSWPEQVAPERWRRSVHPDVEFARP
jgi:phosphotransacetylase/acyl dehydratase